LPGRKENLMPKTETRKLRSDLTQAERERAEKIGDLTFKSHRVMDWRVEEYAGIGPEGRAA
jgi:hypothetical protein